MTGFSLSSTVPTCVRDGPGDEPARDRVPLGDSGPPVVDGPSVVRVGPTDRRTEEDPRRMGGKIRRVDEGTGWVSVLGSPPDVRVRVAGSGRTEKEVEPIDRGDQTEDTGSTVLGRLGRTSGLAPSRDSYTVRLGPPVPTSVPVA